jgi:hypothetical protein
MLFEFVLVRHRVLVRADSHRQRVELENKAMVAGALRGQPTWLGEGILKGTKQGVKEWLLGRLMVRTGAGSPVDTHSPGPVVSLAPVQQMVR